MAFPVVPQFKTEEGQDGGGAFHPVRVEPIGVGGLAGPGGVEVGRVEGFQIELEELLVDHPGDKNPGEGTENGGQPFFVGDGGEGGARAAHDGPEEAEHKEAEESKKLGWQVTRVGIGHDLHVGHGPAEGPTHRAEEREVGRARAPIGAAGEEADGESGEGTGNHCAVLVPEVAPDPPADGEGECDEENGARVEGGCAFSLVHG